MPYTKQERRARVNQRLREISELISQLDSVEWDGELNYAISFLVATVFKPIAGRWRYHAIARAVAVFECAKLEFYRRVGARREDMAILENGDIEPYV